MLLSAGRLTGLLASDLLLVQVLLMSRLPALEHAFGQDELARVHRLVGFTSFNLMIAHVGLITWGYASGDLAATPGELWNLTVSYPGMLLAAAGTICLVMVVVTSVKAARRKLCYESWHLLHVYAYLGVGLALPHQLWTGQDFLASPARTVFWWGLWIASAGAVLVWRVALPLWRSATYGLRVTSVVPEGDGLLSVHLTARGGARMQVEAGQFFSFRFLSGRGWTRAHRYLLSAAPDGRNLRITVKVVGDGSAALRLLRPGTRVLIEGPYGRLSARACTQPKVALIEPASASRRYVHSRSNSSTRPARPSCCTGTPPATHCSSRSWRRSPPNGVWRSSGYPATAGLPGPGSVTGRRGQRPHCPDPLDPRHRRTRRLRLRPRAVGRRRPPHHSGRRPTH